MPVDYYSARGNSYGNVTGEEELQERRRRARAQDQFALANLSLRREQMDRDEDWRFADIASRERMHGSELGMKREGWDRDDARSQRDRQWRTEDQQRAREWQLEDRDYDAPLRDLQLEDLRTGIEDRRSARDRAKSATESRVGLLQDPQMQQFYQEGLSEFGGDRGMALNYAKGKAAEKLAADFQNIQFALDAMMVRDRAWFDEPNPQEITMLGNEITQYLARYDQVDPSGAEMARREIAKMLQKQVNQSGGTTSENSLVTLMEALPPDIVNRFSLLDQLGWE